jgi:hypothetical protein
VRKPQRIKEAEKRAQLFASGRCPFHGHNRLSFRAYMTDRDADGYPMGIYLECTHDGCGVRAIAKRNNPALPDNHPDQTYTHRYWRRRQVGVPA